VRGGATHIDPVGHGDQSATRTAIPMILATGAVHSHLVAQGLRTFCIHHVRSSECLDTHYFAVLIGVGAT
jgi:glutamate synthase (NADPH/NADH) large chain